MVLRPALKTHCGWQNSWGQALLPVPPSQDATSCPPCPGAADPPFDPGLLGQGALCHPQHPFGMEGGSATSGTIRAGPQDVLPGHLAPGARLHWRRTRAQAGAGVRAPRRSQAFPQPCEFFSDNITTCQRGS